MSSTTSSKFLNWFLKILAFLSFQIIQIDACQINQKTFFNCLEFTSPFQQAKWVNMFCGVIKLTPNQFNTLRQINEATSQCKKIWVVVSSPWPHNTRLQGSSGGKTRRSARFDRIGIRSIRTIQKKATTLDRARLFQRLSYMIAEPDSSWLKSILPCWARIELSNNQLSVQIGISPSTSYSPSTTCSNDEFGVAYTSRHKARFMAQRGFKKIALRKVPCIIIVTTRLTGFVTIFQPCLPSITRLKAKILLKLISPSHLCIDSLSEESQCTPLPLAPEWPRQNEIIFSLFHHKVTSKE